jgi:hypothetical protein
VSHYLVSLLARRDINTPDGIAANTPVAVGMGKDSVTVTPSRAQPLLTSRSPIDPHPTQ